MAAALIMSSRDHHCDSDWPEQKIQQSKTGLGDEKQESGCMLTDLSWWCDSVCAQRAPAFCSSTTTLSWQSPFPERLAASKYAWDVECLELAAGTTSSVEVEPPPSYLDSLSDNPPPYALDNSLLDAPRSKITLRQPFAFIDPASTMCNEPLPSMTTPRLDFSDSSNFRQAAKKKKAGQKQTFTAPEEEGSKEPGGGEDNDGGGGAGGSAGGGSHNGDGGAGGDGGGGDGEDWGGDDWGKGKKKKGKKNKGGVNEEEEKKKKHEEEEKEEMERVRKEHEAEETANAGDPLSWANGDANPNDEWGDFGAKGKKNKKNKKGKADPVNGPLPLSNPPDTAAYDNVDLGDTPKLNVDFGGKNSMKETNPSFGFEDWGNSWNTSGFNGGNTGTTDITDTTKDTSIEEPSFWQLSLGSKSKKKVTSPGFDLGGFSTTNDAQEDFGAVEDANGKGNDDWAETVSPVGKKDKKNKKKGGFAFDDTPKEFESIAIGDSKPELEAVGEDTWPGSAWGAPAAKGTKKKGKKAEAELKTSEMSPVSPQSHVAPTAPVEEEGPVFGSKKDKKKKQKAINDEVENLKEPAIEESLEQEAEEKNGWGFHAKKEKKKDRKSIIEETVSHEEPAVTQEADITAEETNWGVNSKKGPKKTKKTPWDEPYGADLASAVVPEPASAEIGWGAGAKKGSKKNKGFWDESKDESKDAEAPGVVTVPESEQHANSLFGFGTKEDSKKKSKKGVTDESNKLVNPVFAFEDVSEPEPGTESDLGALGTAKNESKKKAKKGVSDEPDKAGNSTLAFENELEPEVEPSWGFGTGKKDNKKKSKKGAIEKPDEGNTMVSPAAKPEPEQSFDWGFGNVNNKKKTKKVPLEEPDNPEDQITSPTNKSKPQSGLSWGFETNQDNKKKPKKGVLEDFDNADDPSVPEAFPDAEQDVSAGWSAFGPKSSKKKVKKGTIEEAKHVDDLSVDVPEQTSVVEELTDTWGAPPKKDKKSKKGQFEVKETPMVADPMATIDALNPPANDNWLDWGGDKKKDKKGKKGMAMDAKDEETSSIQPPPPSKDSEPPPSSFGFWGAPKKEIEKKGKKGKPVEPEIEPLINMATDNMHDDTYSGGNGWGDWGLSAKDKTKEEKEIKEAMEWEQRAQRQNEMYEQAEKEKVDKEKEKEKLKPGKKGKSTGSALSKNKDLMTNSTPDPIPTIETDTWGTWNAPKKDKKLFGAKGAFQGAPPPAPTPPAQGLTPEPTPSPVPGLDDLGEADWGNPLAAVTSKGKKDIKKPTKAEESKSDKKEAKDKAGELMAEPPKTKAKNDAKKGAAKEETPAKATRSFWGGMGVTAKSKASKNEEKEEEYKYEENYDEEEREDEINDLIGFEGGADSITDLMDESATKGPKTKADGKLGKVNSKESDKSSKISEKKKKNGKANTNTQNNNHANHNGGNGTGNFAFMTEAADMGVGVAGGVGMGAGAGADVAVPEFTETNNDAWSFWGPKKTSGRKTEKSETPDEPQREIAKHGWTNPIASLNEISNQPEASFFDDDQPEPPKPTGTKTSKATISTMKPSVKSTVAQRVKALEKERLEKEKEKALVPISDPAFDQFEPLAKFDSPPKKVSPFGKSKVTPVGKGPASKKKDPSPPPRPETVEEKQAFQDAVPGSFPAEGADDHITDVIPPLPVAKKTNKKMPKPQKAPQTDLMDFDIPTPSPPVPEVPEIPVVPEASLTPPPEPAAAKPVKKERARVRDEGISSWGFWAASTRKPVKKEAKAKDDGDLPTTAAKERAAVAGLARSKSTKTAKDKETEKVSAKSSGSDKDRKAESRPSKSRGSSFGGLFGGPPPPRARPLRRQSAVTSKNASRRQSVDAEAMGLPSPPAEVAPEMNTKAAKLMGTSGGKFERKGSTRGPIKAAVVPDPYAIDDDDMVMVNGLDYPIVSDPIPKSKGVRKDKSTSTKAKKEVKSVSDPADDIVMVEAGPSSDGAELPSLQEALAFAEPPSAPAPLQRSPTSARKSDNKLMGLFGLRKTRRASEVYERPRSKTFADDDVNLRRKRTVAGDNDATKRARRDERKVRRSERPDIDADGFVTDAPLEKDATEDVEAKNEDRRSKRASRSHPAKEYRESRPRDDEDQRAKRQEADQAQDDMRRAKTRESRDRRSRREEEETAIRKEERRAKRAAKEERATKDERISRDLDPSSAFEGRSKYRERDPRDRDLPPENSSRPRKSDRRRSHVDTPKSPNATERRPRRDERRSSRRTPGEKSSSHRKSTAAPVDDYFDLRNGTAGDIPDPLPDPPPLDPAPRESALPDPVPRDPAPLDPQEPYMHSGANEHTSSWVKSQISEPPPPPPLEPSVLDPAPILGGAGDESTMDEDAKRTMRRQSRRKSRYADGSGDGDRERRRRKESRRDTVRSSEGSAEQERERAYGRRKTDYGGGVPLRGYGTGGGGMGGRRGSWFQKIKGLADAR